MKIIVEGHDAAGKTTLINKLKEHYNISNVIHLTNKMDRSFNFYKNKLLRYRDDVIFDRQFISEFVYSNVLKRDTEITLEKLDELFEYTKFTDYVIIICETSKPNYKPDEYIEVIKKEYKIKAHYRSIQELYGLILYDYTKDSFEDLIEEIESRVDNH